MIGFALIFNAAYGLDVTAIKVARTNGQVFITWKGDVSKNYLVYRTTYKITAATGWPAEAFGNAPAYSTKNVRLTEILSGTTRYFKVPSDNSGNFQVLDPSAGYGGLYVLACTNSGVKYFYGVNMAGSSDSPAPGENTTSAGTKDNLATPKPILQENLNLDNIAGNDMDVYVHFATSVVPTGQRLMMNAGFFDFLGYNFGIVPFTDSVSPAPHPMIVKLHAGGSNFIDDAMNLSTTAKSAYKLCLDDWLPNGETSWWFGYNEKFDISQPFVQQETLPPSCHSACLLNDAACHGLNRDYTIQRILYSIEQVKSLFNNAPNSNPDDNINISKVSLSGRSMGASGGLLIAEIAPEVFSCMSLIVPKADFSFSNDLSMAICAWNFDLAAEAAAHPCYDTDLYLITRARSNARWGTVTSDLPTNISKLDNSGGTYTTYDLLHAGFMTSENTKANKDLPIIFAYSGMNDSGMGWEEKPPFYDSMNFNRQPGMFFWDQGEHKKPLYWDFGASIPLTELIRYSSKQAYPAFSDCNINDEPETTLQGTINGFFDWDENTIADSKTSFSMQLKWRSLMDVNGNLVQPVNDNMITDITLRRQKFPGTTFSGTVCWTLTNLTTLATQSGESVIAYPNGPVTFEGLNLHYPDLYQLSATTAGCRLDMHAEILRPSHVSVQAFPNPFSETLEIIVASGKNEKVSIIVLDIYGAEKTRLQVYTGEGGQSKTTLNTQSWQAGTYLLRIAASHESVTQSVIKIR